LTYYTQVGDNDRTQAIRTPMFEQDDATCDATGQNRHLDRTG
jgi:hypothetical protein